MGNNQLAARTEVVPRLARIALRTSGNTFYVNSATTHTAGSEAQPGKDNTAIEGQENTARGKSIERPFKTLAYASTQCVAGNGDVVYLLPGHTEALTAAAAITLSKAGVRVIGLGQGAARPTLTWSTSTAAQMVISGEGVSIENCILDFTGIDAIVAAISVTGANVSIRNNTIITNSATAGCVLGVLTAATATGFDFSGNKCLGPATNSGTTTTAVVQHEVGVDYTINDNFFTGKMTQAILNATTILGGEIARNSMHIYTGTAGITLAAASTPFVHDNRISVASGTAPIAGAAASFSGNRYTTEGNGPTAGTADAF